MRSINALLIDGSPCVISVPGTQEERLSGTCFRDCPEGQGLAGNFSFWRNAHDVITDRRMMEKFLAALSSVVEKIADNHTIASKNHRFTINVEGEFVGWASTTLLEKVDQDQLEERDLNWRATALFVRSGPDAPRAPRTNEVTFVVEVSYSQKDGWIAIVQTIYPGKDVGELNGDVSRRKQRAFFDWDHPGE